MSKMNSLEQALKNSSGKAIVQPQPAVAPSIPVDRKPSVHDKARREGKENLGAWLNADFGASLRLVQLRRRRDEYGNKVYLADLFAEALNDLFRKYDVPTVHHD